VSGNQRISIHTSDLANYVARNANFADDIGSAAAAHLSGHLSLSPTMFGDLGQETGAHARLGGQLNQLHDHLHSTSGSLRDLGHSVHSAQSDYTANEESFAARLTRLNQP
jgi:hypothetical protein